MYQLDRRYCRTELGRKWIFLLQIGGLWWLLKWERFGELCMYSFWTRWWNVIIVAYGKINGRMQPKGQMTGLTLSWLSTFGFERFWSNWFLFLICLNLLSAERYSCSKFVINEMIYCSKCKLLTRSSNRCFRLDCLLWRGRGGDIEMEWLLLSIILYDREVLRRQLE